MSISTCAVSTALPIQTWLCSTAPLHHLADFHSRGLHLSQELPTPPIPTTCTQKIQSPQKIWRINFSSTYERHEGPGATGAAGLHPRAIGSVSTQSLISLALLGPPPSFQCLNGPCPSSPSFHHCLSCSFQLQGSPCSADGRIPSAARGTTMETVRKI